ncbi:hypothetical protein LOZ61_000708 [Ophidiomyces ophidiicola]|nr:hypothetical protein LOZ61_000708 [Ophidiomyces ophidiicola]KAI1971725.1 hypothetical protein LOZ56_002857 [Ophidiomyces ophidiicola]KAI2027577.1 hypothetical protein LOZ45_002658 [Ophidiomyces ophidiicola]KAI2245278.1 hypothetical protein LOZ13_001133 [Ophidiomyces ophidiicola]KAI2374971.1 hypothetical protein LOY89_003301 [Ophidiomyces ophidiicola]
MSIAPRTLEELNRALASASSPAALLEALTDFEGQICLRFGDTHLAADTEFLGIYYSAFSFALLIQGEINEARMLVRRTPRSLTNADVTLQNTFNLVRAVWNKQHTAVYQILRLLPWPDNLKPLVDAFSTHFNNVTRDDLSAVYGAIRPETAASYLGFQASPAESDTMEGVSGSTAPELIASLVEQGWEYNADTNLLTPIPKASVMDGTELDKIKIRQVAGLLHAIGD